MTPEEEISEYLWWLKIYNMPATVVDAQPWWATEQYRRMGPTWDSVVKSLREVHGG